MMDVVKRYGFSGSLRLFRDVIFTRIFFSSSRLIRFPVFIRGRKYIDLGKGLTTGVNLRLDAFPENINTSERTLIIGNNVQINDYCHIGAVKRVTIGNNVLIASKVYISDHNHGSYKGIDQSSPLIAPGERELSVDPVVIEDNVWLGESVVVLPGVTIGRGSIVGAASVVTKSIPPDSIAVGSPAKVVKKFNSSTNTWDNI